MGFAHAKYLSPHLAKRTVEVVQEAFPMRFKAFHILHEPFYFDAIMAVLKPFLKDKIRRRIHLHGSNMNSLHKYIPKSILPAEYGGEQEPFDNTAWRENILDNEDYFANLESMTSAERKLSGENNNSDTESLNSIPFIDTETEDSEFDENDERILSPRRSVINIQNIEDYFLKNQIYENEFQ